MAGTYNGGKDTAAKITARDPDFYRRIGAIGGKRTGIKKGFALLTPEQRSAAGRKGGTKSRRPKV